MTMINSRGFRIFVLIAIGVLGISAYYSINDGIKQSAARAEERSNAEQARAKANAEQALAKAKVEERNERRNAVKTTPLLLQDVSIIKTDFGGRDGWHLEGVVTNNSKKPLVGMRFTVTMFDCPENPGTIRLIATCPPVGQGRIIGQAIADADMLLYVPAGQTRSFSTFPNMNFLNMPPTTSKWVRWSTYTLIEVSTGDGSDEEGEYWATF
jgi:hypothetical protein